MTRRATALHRSVRGTALLELSLVLPLFVTVLLFGLFLSELVRAKIRVLEASRYAAWELTSHPLSDYGGGDSQTAFELARRKVTPEAVQRYRDLDSAEDALPRGFGFELRNFQLQLDEEPVPFTELHGPGMLQGDGGDWAKRAVQLAGQSAKTSLESWGFNLHGQARAEVSVQLGSTFLPRPLALTLRSQHALIADGWQLLDGADASIARGRAGNHEGGSSSGLYLQVKRMRFWGDEGFIDSQPSFLGAVQGVLPFALPSLSGAFVVSHNYRADPDRSCQGIPGYPAEARGGLSNLDAKGQELLDHPKAQCFDTAPFRDTQEYARSLYLQMFKARGDHFMGCQNAQADDPSSSRDPSPGDRDLRKVDCEVGQ